ncbi:SLC13 family permease [Pueribacillus sp. YX66]|uniref:SLC13 family permease n=1 Tax=Pueribacillus sp. YX66 TaxID=3229242 RepID=UPI00358D2F0D
MDIQIVITFIIVITMIALFMLNRFQMYQVFLASVVLLWIFNIVSLRDIFESFINETIFMIAMLFPVITVIQQSTDFKTLLYRLMVKAQSYRQVVVRMMTFTSLFSAFFNNTPLVMMMIPIIKKWGMRSNIPASKLLIPLSYAAIVGGMCTLIGTATNLIVSSLLEQSGYERLHMFELSVIGVPIVVVTMMYVALTGNQLLPALPNKRLSGTKEQLLTIHSKKQRLNVLLFFIMLLIVSFQQVTMFQAMFILLMIYLFNRSLRFKNAISSINWRLLTIVGSSSVLAIALINSGTTNVLADWLIKNVKHEYVLLLIIYSLTNVLTEFISNYGAAAFIFPIALSLSSELSLNIMPFAVAIAIAASASFSTPIGYQTNLLIYEKGGYRFVHFLKIGLSLNILIMLITLVLIPIFWNF